MHPRTDRRRNSGQRKLADSGTEKILLTAFIRQERWCNGELRASPAVLKNTGWLNPGRMQGKKAFEVSAEPLKPLELWSNPKTRQMIIKEIFSRTEHGL